jgi:cellulose synthase/poly-beta-1,6-N-acetylglucosamine synthase-like glycosyltransferase
VIASVLVALSLGGIVYVLFGYPLLLALIASRFEKPIRRGKVECRVSFLIAVHNGEEFLEAKLVSILHLDYPPELVDIFVLSDGSTDDTEAIARRFSHLGVRLLALPRRGKAAALTTGMREADGDILVFTDVRQQLAPDSLRLLLENFADPAVGVASGALTILDAATHEEADTGLYWRYELWIRDRLSRIDSIFGATGAYYAVRRELTAPIPDGTLLDDVYLPLFAFLAGYRLIVDARAKAFDRPTGLETEFRRKVRTLAGNYQILIAWPRILGPTNRLWFHFWSYKFGRLLLPFALIAMFAASFALPGSWSYIAVALQTAFYGIAVADLWIRPSLRLKRLTSPVRTFVTLMGAGILALSVFFVPSNTLWTQSGMRSKP